MNDSQSDFATRAIHHGYDPSQNEGALTPPLHLTSTFVFESAEAGGEMFAGERSGHFYSRISNPTNDLLERRIASLEGAEAGLALASVQSPRLSGLYCRPEMSLLRSLRSCSAPVWLPLPRRF